MDIQKWVGTLILSYFEKKLGTSKGKLNLIPKVLGGK